MRKHKHESHPRLPEKRAQRLLNAAFYTLNRLSQHLDELELDSRLIEFHFRRAVSMIAEAHQLLPGGRN